MRSSLKNSLYLHDKRTTPGTGLTPGFVGKASAARSWIHHRKSLRFQTVVSAAAGSMSQRENEDLLHVLSPSIVHTDYFLCYCHTVAAAVIKVTNNNNDPGDV